MTNDARCIYEIKFSTAMAKAEFNKRKAVFKSVLAIIFRRN